MILMVPHQLQKCSPSRLCLCPVLLKRSDLGLLVALIFHAGSVRGGLSNPPIIQDKVGSIHTSGNAQGIPPREEPATRRRLTRARGSVPFPRSMPPQYFLPLFLRCCVHLSRVSLSNTAARYPAAFIASSRVSCSIFRATVFKNFLRAIALGAVFRMNGQQNVTGLDLPFVSLCLILRTTHAD